CDGNTTQEEDKPVIVQPTFGSNDDARTANASLTVSNDGETIVFESPLSLTPQAIEGDPHVYEYRRGNVYLISDGHDQAGSSPPAQLVSLDATGRDAFLTTIHQLVSADIDTQLDVYDARVEGGFPAASELAECSG